MSETSSVHKMFSPGLSLEFSCIELVINLSSYCGLVDAKIRAFDKDLPVPVSERMHECNKNIGTLSIRRHVQLA